MKVKHFLWILPSLLFVSAIVYLLEQRIVYKRDDLKIIYGFLSRKPIIENDKLIIHLSTDVGNRKFFTDRAGFRVLQKEKIKKELSKGDFVKVGISKALIRNHKNNILLCLSSDRSTYISLQDYNQERRNTFRVIFYFLGGIVIIYLLTKLIKQ
ncbi:hypothetical protein BKI52_15590 [marine bacterium AO1-C]|nr:hypothetical protein BKI52_15590 [marine bacterium AO1-C]